MIEKPTLAVVAVACTVAALVWARSTRRLYRVSQRIDASAGPHTDVAALSRSAFRKELHTALLYALLALAAGVTSFSSRQYIDAIFVAVLIPVVFSLRHARSFLRHARLAEGRSQLEQRAQEVLVQEHLAPKRWAERLAPEQVPDFEGFEIGSLYEAGTGLMAGDFYDVFRTAPTRLAVVIGDVAGHGIEPSITAFQCKYLLRVFLRQFRDPAQALEELNAQMYAQSESDEFISLCVVLFDTDAGTLRYASAGHPPGWLWHERELQPLRATGPLLTLEATSPYVSREVPLSGGDLLVVYTDGLAEARDGELLFGEERVAALVRREAGAAPDVLCKTLLEAAQDFAGSPISDDIAIVAVRRV
jgi:serine phosphatase RsbU (regulator of sigma subunit)